MLNRHDVKNIEEDYEELKKTNEPILQDLRRKFGNLEKELWRCEEELARPHARVEEVNTEGCAHSFISNSFGN